MNISAYDMKDTIFALATPWGTSALAIIRVSGPESISLLEKAFSRPDLLHNAKTNRVVHGILRDPRDGSSLDEVVLTVFREGHGYTGEESIEISCHGSLSGIESILSVLQFLGMRSAQSGEFTFRAFMHGRIDLTQAEAVQEIVASRSRTAQTLALHRLEGALFDVLHAIKLKVLDVLALVEVQLDYAEDEIGGDVTFPFETVVSAKESIDALLGTYEVGRLYGQGARIVLAGSTNAGKSTLFNLLLKEERSIVSEIHGTTRDFIEAETVIGGVPARIYDTAGLRESNDAIEAEGMRRTERLLEQSDLILLLIDGSEALQDEFRHAGVEKYQNDPRCIVVWNKSDLSVGKAPSGSFPLSAKKGKGYAELEAEILRRLRRGGEKPAEDQVVIESARQRDALVRSAQALEAAMRLAKAEVPLDIVAIELNEAMDALGSLTGEVASTDILEHIFSGFCVGK